MLFDYFFGYLKNLIISLRKKQKQLALLFVLFWSLSSIVYLTINFKRRYHDILIAHYLECVNLVS